MKNAFAYVTRKSLKSLIIMLVILSMSILSFISLSIKDATDRASKETFANITNSFSMEINRQVNPGRCVIEESQRYLRLEHEDKESYVSYFTVNAIVGELDFPSSEIFYFQQQQFTFPVDTSMNVEIVENRKALTTVRNKKKN